MSVISIQYLILLSASKTVEGRGVFDGIFFKREGGDFGIPRAMAMYGGWCANELKR